MSKIRGFCHIFAGPFVSRSGGLQGHFWLYGGMILLFFSVCRGDRSGYHFMEKKYFFIFRFLTLQANFFALLAPFSSIIYGILAKFMIFGDFGPF